ncbi:MAG: O-antigen ligase family protein [Candidatus Competibacter sp.]|nr:O-antigen ligase family protein [Candidatus Competibacter sp.]MDG4584918.1 O-antigen ligase family protein [Candidatus Competibacter sp.]
MSQKNSFKNRPDHAGLDINDRQRSLSRGFNLYLLFTVSWFLHLPARYEILGTVRFDFLLVLILIGLAISSTLATYQGKNYPGKPLNILIIYILLTIPLVEWPGSVIKIGIPNFTKAVVFYYFTVSFVKSEKNLRIFVLVFVACQLFRIIEPLYLHITEGYWGSVATMADWQFLSRLSGAPSDIINPNGLAFVICTVLPFLYFLAPLSRIYWLVSLVSIPLAIYTLILTGSRSGMIGMGAIIIGIVLKSKRRVTLSALILVAGITSFPLISTDMQDRYFSIFGMGEKNAGTADDRMDGMISQLQVILRRPIFGHGLGTSPEANFNFVSSGPYVGSVMPAHNLYIEIGQELGLIGVVLFLMFMKSIYLGFSESKLSVAKHDPKGFLQRLIDALQVWFLMNFIFSFASYGLSGYEWYLFGGISAVIQRLVQEQSSNQ